MIRTIRNGIIAALLIAGIFGLSGCSRNSSAAEQELPLVYEDSLKLQYAENFSIDYYAGGYSMITTKRDGSRFLIVPEQAEAPEGLEEDIVILKQPIQDIYLVASAVMDMFCQLDGLDAISFSGQKQENWYIEDAKNAMAEGRLLYAGKYNRPDYEQLVSRGCRRAIENGMIAHAPEVVEKLEDFGIPVLMEASSYEAHPLGRVEWIKLFGALLGKEEAAERIFQEQADILNRISEDQPSEKTVAFFFVSSNGMVQVRQSSDYIPRMIELAGGRYIFENLGDPESRKATMNMQAEEFYHKARNADFLIYNSSIDGGISTIKELLDKCEFLEDFQAVKEGNVWCTSNDMYQQSLSIGYLMEDMHRMLQGDDTSPMHYLFEVQ